MSKKVTVTAYCDGEHEVETLATVERMIALDSGIPVLLDLCDDDNELIERVRALMERGVAVKQRHASMKSTERKSRAKEPVDMALPCPQPGCEFTGKNRAGLGQHTSSGHGMKLDDYPNQGWVNGDGPTTRLGAVPN